MLNLNLNYELNPDPESEPEQEPTPAEPVGERFDDATIIQWISLFSLCMIVIIAGNVIIIVVLLRNKKTRTKQANMFFLSLLIARTSVAILVIPARITGLFSNELLGSALCRLCHFAGRGSAVTSVLSTTAVALAKYQEIVNPNPVPMKTTVKLLCLIWGLGYAWAIRAPILNNLFLADTVAGPLWVCSVDPEHVYTNSIFIFIDFILLFFIPFIIVVFCYYKVIKVLNDMRQHAKASCKSDTDKMQMLAHVKGIRMLIVVMILFTVCYSLPYIFKLYIFFNQINVLMSNFAEIEMWVYWISYSNPWLNIFAYIIFRDDIRSGLVGLCGKTQKQQNKVEPSPASSTTTLQPEEKSGALTPVHM